MSDISLQGVETLDLESDSAVKTLIRCCDPNTTFTCEGDLEYDQGYYQQHKRRITVMIRGLEEILERKCQTTRGGGEGR